MSHAVNEISRAESYSRLRTHSIVAQRYKALSFFFVSFLEHAFWFDSSWGTHLIPAAETSAVCKAIHVAEVSDYVATARRMREVVA
jgi:hypothetical protein